MAIRRKEKNYNLRGFVALRLKYLPQTPKGLKERKIEHISTEAKKL